MSSLVAAPSDLHASIVPAVLEWAAPSTASTATATPSVSGEEKRCIVRPDPRSAVILFEIVCPSKSISTNAENENSPLDVFLQVRIPIKLKYPVGRTHIHVSIHPSRIASLSFAADVEAEEDVSDKLPGRLARLAFTLREPPQVIIPANTPISLLPASTRASGEILDAMQSLGRATSLSIVMPASQAPRRRLEPLCEALADGGSGLNPLPRYDDLRSLFGGTGGQILVFPPPPAPTPSEEETQSEEEEEAGPSGCPPVYAEIGPGPPMPPISAEPDAKDVKRRRCSNSSTASHASSPYGVDHGEKRRRLLEPGLPLPTARSSKEEQDTIMDAMAQRLMAIFETRFDEQNRVIQAQGELIAALQKQTQEQDHRIEELESDLAEARKDVDKVWDKVESLDVDVWELDGDWREVKETVEYWTEDGWDELKTELEEAVTGSVLDSITERIAEEGLRAHSVNFTWTNE
jgi:uncharacterized protein YoxC